MAVQWMTGGYSLNEEIVVESCTLIVLGTMTELARRQNEQKTTPV